MLVMPLINIHYSPYSKTVLILLFQSNYVRVAITYAKLTQTEVFEHTNL
jgi:LPS sulfotransferase NodH